MSTDTIEATETTATDIQAQIDAAVTAAITGLSNKNRELLGKLKDSNASLQKFDGIDVDAVNAIMKQFASDEEAGLIKSGKIDEVLSKRTERMSADFTKKLTAESDRATRAEAKAAKLADRTLAGSLRDAAMKAGVLPEALEDIVLRSRGIWRLSDDGDAVAMNGDEIVLGKDGKTPLSPIEWAESLRETAAHLWPKAQGTGAQGGNKAPSSGKKTITRAEFDGLDMVARAIAVKESTITD